MYIVCCHWSGGDGASDFFDSIQVFQYSSDLREVMKCYWEGVFIGTVSAVREKITIGPWSMIGGGALVKDQVPGGVLYAGVPAVFKKKLS
jgi:hypothetical protein